LWFLEKLKLPKHSVNGNKINELSKHSANGNKINLRIPEIHQVDSTNLSIVDIKANIFDDFVSFSILSLIPSPNRMFLAAATDRSRHYNETKNFESGTSNIIRD